MPAMVQNEFENLLNQSADFLKRVWIGESGIEALARTGAMTPEQFSQLYQKAYGAAPNKDVLDGLFTQPGGGATQPPTGGGAQPGGGGGIYGTGVDNPPADSDRMVDPFLEQERDPSGVFSRWWQTRPGYENMSPVLRNLGFRQAGNRANEYLLSQAADPQGAVGGEAGEWAPSRLFYSFLNSGQRPTGEQARQGLGNIAGALRMTEEQAAGNPFAQYAQGRYLGDEGEETGELLNLLGGARTMGMNPAMAAYTNRGINRLFSRYRDRNPGQSLMEAAKGWGWY